MVSSDLRDRRQCEYNSDYNEQMYEEEEWVLLVLRMRSKGPLYGVVRPGESCVRENWRECGGGRRRKE